MYAAHDQHKARRRGGRVKKILFGVAAGAVAFAGFNLWQSQDTIREWASSKSQKKEKTSGKVTFQSVPSRDVQKTRMQNTQEFDILVIGGGATGAGIALDAATRGLSVGLIEKDDFASGTSSKSTKLIHGGVRYLEKAVKQFDPGALSLVFEALNERSTFLRNAPHLTNQLPIMTPCYKWWEVPYYYAGLKMYDLLAGLEGLTWARFHGAAESLRQFPQLRKKGLKGSVVYYDGQMDDSRMNVALALTAAHHGATVLNHVEAVKLLKTTLSPSTLLASSSSSSSTVPATATNPTPAPSTQQSIPTTIGSTTSDQPSSSNDGEAKQVSETGQGGALVVKQPQQQTERVCGATVRDTITGEQWDVRAKVVINATGPFSDWIRKMDDPKTAEIITPSSGVHITLPDYYSPNNTGLIVPKTKDGRVVFLLPWQGRTIAGTTDTLTKVTHFPHPHENEINFILEAIADYVSVNVRREDVLAAWSGIRPLAKDPNASTTASASRDHVIEVSKHGLLTIAGGKWTTYRRMAQDTVDRAVEVGNLQPKNKCRTKRIKMLGADKWDPAFFTKLVQNYVRAKTIHSNNSDNNNDSSNKVLKPLDSEVAQHLSRCYGTRALQVAELAQSRYGNKLSEKYPYLEAEVVFAAKEEYACTTVDAISRRMRLAFLDAEVANVVLPRVNDLMAETLGWDEARKQKELEDAKFYLHIMNVGRTDPYKDEQTDSKTSIF